MGTPGLGQPSWLSFSEKDLKRQWQSYVYRCHSGSTRNLARPIVLWLEAVLRPATPRSELRRAGFRLRRTDELFVDAEMIRQPITLGNVARIFPNGARSQPHRVPTVYSYPFCVTVA
jgi:hypothetical protein